MDTTENKCGLGDLLEKIRLDNSDILILEDVENTKKVTFINFRKSLIEDAENPDGSRIWSSGHIAEYIEEIKKALDERIGNAEETVGSFDKSKVNVSDLAKELNKIEVNKASAALLQEVIEEVSNKRALNVKLNSTDFLCESDAKKFHMEHLGADVLAAMTGNTPVTVPAVPKGGWSTEDLQNGLITPVKLSSDYRFRGSVVTGSINTIIEDGLYLIGTNVTALPKFSNNEVDPKMMEVIKYGEDGKYIRQRVYYIDSPAENISRPSYFERIGETAKLHLLEFVAHFEVTDYNKVGADLLAPTYNNRGEVTTGSVYDLIENGCYHCASTVSDLPISGTSFLVTVQNYGETVEYSAKTVENAGSRSYASFIYFDSAHMPVRGEWFNTGTNLKSKFDGKNVHLFGDGIVYGLGASSINETSLPALLQSKYGYKVYNHALSDATVGVYGNDNLKAKSLITQVQNAQQLNNADYAIIFASSNDYRGGISAIGSDYQKDDITYKGALNIAIEKLLAANPKIKILLVSPLFRGSISPGDGNNSDDTMISDKYLAVFASAVTEIAVYNHIPCADLFNESGINKYTSATYLASNGIHLSDEGSILICDKINDAMCRYY